MPAPTHPWCLHNDRAEHVREQNTTIRGRQVGPSVTQPLNVNGVLGTGTPPHRELGLRFVHPLLMPASALRDEPWVHPSEVRRKVRLQRAERSVNLLLQPGTLPRPVNKSGRVRVMLEHPPEHRLDQFEQFAFAGGRGSRAFTVSVPTPAPIHPPFRPLVRGERASHHGSTIPATHKPGEHGRILVIPDRVRSWDTPLPLGGSEQAFINQWLVCALGDSFPGARFTEVRAVAKHVSHPTMGWCPAARCSYPELVKPPGDAAAPLPTHVPSERFGHKTPCVGVGLEASIRCGEPVPERWRVPPMPPTFKDVPVNDLLPSAHGAPAEEVGHRQELREQEVPGVVAAEVASVRSDDYAVVCRDERSACPFDASGDHCAVRKVTTEPVHLCDDEAGEVAAFDLGYEVFEVGSVIKRAGHVYVFAKVRECVPVLGGPSLDGFALFGDGEPLVGVAVPLAGNAHVAAKLIHAPQFTLYYGEARTEGESRCA